ncbi:hypothetical protein FKM82_027865 [Ascaphus truei]
MVWGGPWRGGQTGPRLKNGCWRAASRDGIII